MADMLVKLFQTPSSQETEKDLSDSGIRIKERWHLTEEK